MPIAARTPDEPLEQLRRLDRFDDDQQAVALAPSRPTRPRTPSRRDAAARGSRPCPRRARPRCARSPSTSMSASIVAGAPRAAAGTSRASSGRTSRTCRRPRRRARRRAALRRSRGASAGSPCARRPGIARSNARPTPVASGRPSAGGIAAREHSTGAVRAEVARASARRVTVGPADSLPPPAVRAGCGGGTRGDAMRRGRAGGGSPTTNAARRAAVDPG